jgi:RHS repeat-associated protein
MVPVTLKASIRTSLVLHSTLLCVLLAIQLAVPHTTLAAPVINSISPTSGAPFTQVTINGSFPTYPGFVTFNGALAQLVSWSPTKIVVKAPDGLAGSGPVKVNNQGNSVTFSFIPTIVAVLPPTVKASGLIGILGENFGSSGTATLNGSKLTTVLWTNYLIIATVPSNAVTGPVTVTTSVGASNSVTLTVKTGTLPLAISAMASPPPNSNGWNNSTVTVTFVCGGGVAPVSCPAPQTVSTQGANQVITGTAKDASGATATAKVTVNLDETPPTITATVSPAPDASGWNRTSPVTVTFTCADSLSGVASCPSPQTVSTQGAGQVITGMASDKAGNTASTTVTVNLETTLPSISLTATPAANSAGWNNTPVTVSFTCTPSLAPITSCPANQTVSTQGQAQLISGTVVDAAGNSATATVKLNIDLTPPSLSINSPANGTTVNAGTLSVTGGVSDSLSGISSVTCNGAAATVSAGTFTCSVALTLGSDTINVQATDVAGNQTTQSVQVSYVVAPTITGFSPGSASEGSLVTVTGTNFNANGGTPLVTLNQQGGGTIPAPVSSFTATSLSFVIPSGAASGPITVAVNGQSATSSSSLTISSSSTFAVSVVPSTATLLAGQSVTLQVSLSSANGFTQLASLGISGLPSGVTASFQPAQISSSGSSLLTLSAPATQAASSSNVTVTASASVQGIPQTQSSMVGLTVQTAGSVAFQGRAAVTNPSLNIPLVGLTVRFMGVNYTGASTGCTASTTTDSGGNFIFSSLPSACSGPQMVQYDPSTVTSPPGSYSGVNLSYVLTPGQVTTPGLVVHLPQVNNAETVMVTQNSSNDQTFNFKTVPGVTITVYAGTTLSLSDGTQPNPFPLSVVEIPYEQVPDYMPPNPTQVPVFAMSIEPFNSSASQPVAVSFPNRTNSAPGSNMPLTSLNPTLGMMVLYGTGTVSADGSQVVPNLDPKNPGHLYGISHFDWHFPLPDTPNNNNPCPDCNVPGTGDPIDPGSGLAVITNTDIAFGGARGQIAITRTFRGMSVNPGPFGIGTNFNYGYMLDTTNGAPGGYTVGISSPGTINLIMPDGNQFPFTAQANGTYMNTTIPTMSGAVISNLSPVTTFYGSGFGGTLRWKNGTVFQFQPLLIGQPWIAFLTSITDPNGNVTTLVHSPSVPNEIVQVIDAVGRSMNLSYDGNYRVTSITDPIGRIVQYTYNSQGTLATVINPGGGVTKYTYDSSNNLLTITDPNGNTYTNTYDQNGRVIKQVAPDGGVTTFTYTPLNPVASAPLYVSTGGAAVSGGSVSVGSVGAPPVNTSPIAITTVTDPVGNTTTYHFNPAGFLLDVTNGLGEMTVYNTDSGSGEILGVTDPLGRTTAYTYDANGNTTSVTRLAGTSAAVTTTFAYDPTFNKVTTATDPLGHTTTLKYDGNGNLLSLTDALGEQVSFTYDGNGELTASIDPLGNSIQFGYSNGDLSRITDPLGRVSAGVSDGASRLITVTNPLGQANNYQYDALNDLVGVTDPLGQHTAFTYDANRNLTAVADALSHSRTYTYDSMNRIASSIDPLGRTETYLHDQNGNLTQFIDRRGTTTTYSYDSLNRRIQASFGGQESTNYSYDAGGRLVQGSDSVTGVVVRTYDNLDRLVGEVTPQGSLSYTYDAADRRISMNVSGQSAVAYTYDAANRVTQIAQGSSTVTLAYDNAGHRVTVMLPNNVTLNYEFDAASQVTAVNYSLGTSAIGNLVYSYDLASRETSVGGSFARTGMPPALSSAVYNADNQPTTFGSLSLSYDANGNLTNDGANVYTWNARNQLASITGSVSANFQYDAFGRRVTKEVGAVGISYLFDGVNPVEELSGSTVAAAMLTGFGTDEFFQRTDASGTAGYLTDVLGNTVALTNSAGAVQTQYTYEPFGNTTTVGSSSNPYQFTGRENDGTPLYYARARYYHPLLQRFISEDPAGIGGGDTNLYAYVNENPLTYKDPFGEGIVDCAAELAQLAYLEAKLAQRLAEQAAATCKDKGHQKAIDQLRNAVEAQRAKVARHCSDADTKKQLALMGAIALAIALAPESGGSSLGLAWELAAAF